MLTYRDIHISISISGVALRNRKYKYSIIVTTDHELLLSQPPPTVKTFQTVACFLCQGQEVSLSTELSAE